MFVCLANCGCRAERVQEFWAQELRRMLDRHRLPTVTAPRARGRMLGWARPQDRAATGTWYWAKADPQLASEYIHVPSQILEQLHAILYV